MSINICVIGLGTVGKKRFEIFNDHSDVDEVSFFDPKIKKFYKDLRTEQQLGYTVYTSTVNLHGNFGFSFNNSKIFLADSSFCDCDR